METNKEPSNKDKSEESDDEKEDEVEEPTAKANSDDEQEKENPKMPSPDTKKMSKKKTNPAKKCKADSEIRPGIPARRPIVPKRSNAGPWSSAFICRHTPRCFRLHIV